MPGAFTFAIADLRSALPAFRLVWHGFAPLLTPFFCRRAEHHGRLHMRAAEEAAAARYASQPLRLGMQLALRIALYGGGRIFFLWLT